MGEPIRLHVRGSGGAVFDLDVPDEGTHARERLVERLVSGDLTALDDDGDPIDRVALVVELSPDVEDAPDPVDVDPLDGMTAKQLRSFAAANDIDLGDARTKAELLEVIHAADAVDNDD